MKLSVLSLYKTDLTRDHKGQEDRSRIMDNRIEQLIQLISKVHSMYLGLKISGVDKALFLQFSMETNRKRFEAHNFFSIRLLKLDCNAQVKFLVLHKYSLAYFQCAVYEKCTLCSDVIIYVHAPNNQIVGWSLVNCLLCFFHCSYYFLILHGPLLRTIHEQNHQGILDSLSIGQIVFSTYSLYEVHLQICEESSHWRKPRETRS